MTVRPLPITPVPVIAVLAIAVLAPIASAGDEPCVLDCPPGAAREGETCGGRSINGGCNDTPEVFSPAACGQVICGTAWADGGVRDTDWFIMEATDAAIQTSTTVVTEFEGVVVAFPVNPDCSVIYVLDFFFPAPCEPIDVPGYVLEPGQEHWWFIGTAGFDGVPCGTTGPFGNDYVATFSCSVPSCPELGDLDGDGDIDFDDVLTVLASWGPCP